MEILEQARRPLGIKELLRVAGIHPGAQTEVKRVLRDLLRSGSLEKDGKRFFVPGKTGEERSGPPLREVAPSRAAPRPKSEALGRREKPDKKGRAPARAPFRDSDSPRGRKPPLRKSPPNRRGAKGEVVEGILHVHRDGFGFVHPLTGEGQNIFLPPHEVRKAMDNDVVQVEVFPSSGGRSEGMLLDVRERRRRHVVGIYHARDSHSFVSPSDSNLQGVIRVPPTQIARDGDMVKVTLGVGAAMLSPGEGLVGEVAGSLGQPGHPSQEVLSIAFSQGFSDEFPPEAMEEADAFPTRIEGEDLEGRRDLRAMGLVTIDGEDARDFDDAIYVERQGEGYRLVVAIADVSHYVTPRSSLDAEALHRATSVYLPDRVLPMLPERLSNGLCSLRPNEDRLCMVADMQFDSRAERKSFELYPAVMRSAARCTYNEVQDVLEGRDVPHRNAFRERFQLAMDLSRALTRMRERRGAIDFDIPETRVVLDEKGDPLRMERRPRKDSHRLVEECMLAANEAVAAYFQELELPCVYRYHAEPDEEKLALFSDLAAAHGFVLKTGGDVSSKDLNILLEKLEGHPERRALNQLLLRSMMQAVYTATNVGHYGLAADYYLHFTSPIRRYPDLLVHRLLKEHWAAGKRRPSDAKKEADEAHLDELAVQSSQRERAAMQVEREVFAFYATLHMKARLGEEFDAVVSSITDFGFFVELEHELVEGLVKGEKLGPDFDLDVTTHTLVYSSGRKVRVGQRLRVQLIGASLERRQLDFDVVAFEGEGAPRRSLREAPEAPPARRGRGGPQRPVSRSTPAQAHPPRGASPSRWQPRELPEAEPREEARSGSPHPGFDRLRALAAKRGSAPVSDRPDRLGRRPKKGGGGGKGGKRRR